MDVPLRGRAAAPAAVLLAAVQAAQAVLLRSEAAYLSVLLVAAAALGAVAAAGLWWHRCFPARFTLVLVAAPTLLLEGLLLVLGLPGMGHTPERPGMHATSAAAALGAVVVLVLLRRAHSATLRANP